MERKKFGTKTVLPLEKYLDPLSLDKNYDDEVLLRRRHWKESLNLDKRRCFSLFSSTLFRARSSMHKSLKGKTNVDVKDEEG